RIGRASVYSGNWGELPGGAGGGVREPRFSRSRAGRRKKSEIARRWRDLLKRCDSASAGVACPGRLGHRERVLETSARVQELLAQFALSSSIVNPRGGTARDSRVTES